MFLSAKNLIGLPVETESGIALGKVRDFEIDCVTQTVRRYFVKSRNLIGKILSEGVNEIIINNGQIISIDAEKMVVLDATIKEKQRIENLSAMENKAGAMTRKLSVSKANDNYGE